MLRLKPLTSAFDVSGVGKGEESAPVAWNLLRQVDVNCHVG